MTELRLMTVARGRALDRDVLVVVLAAAAGLAAVAGATQVPVPILSDYGLVAVLPPLFWAGLAALNILFGVSIRAARPRLGVMLLLQLILVVVVYGAPGFASGTARTEVAWRHLGVVGQLAGSGRIDPTIDAYFNWPGFFAGVASYLGVTGVRPETVALVAPIVNGLLWSAGVALVVRALTKDAHHVWMAVWLFTLLNWIDQDYLSPQAFAFFMYLMAVALMLKQLGATPALSLRQALAVDRPRGAVQQWWASRSPDEPVVRRRVAAFWLVILLTVGIVTSHQLTPFMLLAAVAVLTVTGRSWAPGLSVIVGLILMIWLTTAASAYLNGHPVLFATDLGQSAGANVTARIHGSIGHIRVTRVRAGLTLFTFTLAAIGALRMLRRGRRDLRPVLLMLVPFGMVPVQSYGGEMFMRATLFALPFAAYLGAAAFLPRERRGEGVRWAPVFVCVTLLLSVVLMTARYGNARFDVFSRAEIQGSRAIYRLAPPGALLVTVAHPTPWRFQDYTTFRQVVLTDMCPQPLRAGPCYSLLRARAHHEAAGALLMLSRAGEDSVRMQEDPSGEVLRRLETDIVHGNAARLVFMNSDVRIYRFPPRAEKGA